MDVCQHAKGRDRKLEAFFLDINCQYASHLRNLAGAEILEELRCHVGWLHSKSGHGLDCQLKFSAMFAKDLGRAIGEDAEQLHVRIHYHGHKQSEDIMYVIVQPIITGFLACNMVAK